jgi:diadenosine tetraphosphate (Ap4A) HIT family hydrolase
MENPTTGEKCPFCHVDREVIIKNQDAMAILDLYPVSAGHALVIPKIHVTSVFDLPNPVYVACFNLVRELKSILQSRYNPDGFKL